MLCLPNVILMLHSFQLQEIISMSSVNLGSGKSFMTRKLVMRLGREKDRRALWKVSGEECGTDLCDVM